MVLGDGVAILDSSAPGTDRSQELSNYSSDALNSPPQQLSALVGFRTSLSEREDCFSGGNWDFFRPGDPSYNKHRTSGARTSNTAPIEACRSLQVQLLRRTRATRARLPAASPHPPWLRCHSQPTPQNTPRSRFTELISTQGKLSFWVLFSAALIAAGLGALHALEPGHGKTIVAAYLVGSRGTARHAVLLGIVVTAAHTAGVYLLGALTLYASRYIVPEQLYPWLGAISGLSVAGLGIFIFLRHWTGETGEHSHAPGEQHSHWFLSIFKQAAIHRAEPPEPANRAAISADSKPVERVLSLRELCMLGITGGIVPCPAALVVLLSAFSLHRIGFGLFLITAFSFGLAAVLVIVGLTMVYAKRMMSSRDASWQHCPPLSSFFVICIHGGAGCGNNSYLLSHQFTSRMAFSPKTNWFLS